MVHRRKIFALILILIVSAFANLVSFSVNVTPVQANCNNTCGCSCCAGAGSCATVRYCSDCSCSFYGATTCPNGSTTCGGCPSSYGPSSYGPSGYGPSGYGPGSYGPSSYGPSSYGPSSYPCDYYYNLCGANTPNPGAAQCTSGCACAASPTRVDHPTSRVCGDGVVTSFCLEQCDDGNAISGDGCSSACRTEICGDGIVQPGIGEQCDLGAANSNNPNAACRTGGSIACKNRFCGDGIVDTSFGEECDNPTNPAVCSSSCELVATGTPWISSSEGSMYATGGYSGITAQNVSTLNPPITLAAYGYDYNKPVNLTEFILFSGNGSLPTSYRSENNFVGTNYTDNALKLAGAGTMYDYMREQVAKKSTITNITTTQINAGSIAAQIGPVAAGAFTVRERVGDYTFASGAICDVKAVYFISGNLTIDPDFRVSGNTNGCMFIVKGNVTIGPGTRKNAATVLAGDPTQYDIVEAMFIVDGQFNTPLDVFTDGRKGDGLYLKGGLIGERVDLRRDLTGYSNTRQPAEIFIYDGRYVGIPELARILDSKEIALREF